MDTESGKLTVFFEGPFWVGVFERISGGKLSVCKVTFGAEPKDCEVWDFILKHYHGLTFGPGVEAEVKKFADHPKRRQRSIKRQLQASGVGTKSQQALQMQREEMKAQKKQTGKEQQEAERQRRFDLRQQKRKAKHRGR
ncbi:MAG: YjdF family protein [Oscillospiraceae bacterium]|jgi:hypothetical protein|nr:YjdF family protein [Oscillospiraceae bacterium]